MYDILVIGAGVIGCAISMELSKLGLKTAVIERSSDVCEGTSKANSAIIHAGYDAKPGTLKAKFNVLGNNMIEELSKKLDFPFKRIGSMVLCFDDSRKDELETLYNRGLKNGVQGLEILDRKEAIKIEPALSENVTSVLYAKTAGIVCPFNMTIAFAENAAVNGVDFFLNQEVTDISKSNDLYKVTTNSEIFESKIVINCAGVYADKLHNMVSDNKIHITPRRGEYCLLDKNVGKTIRTTLFQLPGEYGKGILLTPTVHGNLLVGPTSVNEENPEGIYTTSEGLDKVIVEGSKSITNFPYKQVITSFAGLRAHEDNGDFIIGEVADSKGFIDVAGIESPGLSCAPAIGKYVADIVKNITRASYKSDYIDTRKGIPAMGTASDEQKAELIKTDSSFAHVVCRCELITEGEIKAAIHRPLGATTLDGVKRRTRAGMGRCQAGFCSPKTLEIIERELKLASEMITKCGGSSSFITGTNKEGFLHYEI